MYPFSFFLIHKQKQEKYDPLYIFSFFLYKMKKGKTEKHFVLYIPSYCFSFSESIIENRKM